MSEPRRVAEATTNPWPVRTFALSVAAWGCLHVATIFTENINWDEFALLARVERMVATGVMQGGGRPGAIEIVLAPFVRGCTDAVASLRHARLLTALAVFVAIAGLYALTRRVRADRDRPAHGAWCAVALLVFSLPFQRWSLQVRTDPFAVAWGLWGAVTLLSASRKLGYAAVAGICFGLGYLFTEKVLYIMLLGAWLRACTAQREPRATMRRLLAEFALCCCAGAGTFLAYRSLLPMFYEPPRHLRLGRAFEIFATYRDTFGFALHRGLVWAIVPHLLLVALLVVATAQALRNPSPRRDLVVSWGALLLAVLVASFHAAMFPYFWTTLGMFVALALGNASEEIANVVPARVGRLALSGWIACLIVPTVFYAVQLLDDDTQRTQRDALAFIARDFGPNTFGYQVEGALACRHDPDPFPVWFRPHIEAELAAGKLSAVEAFVERFRAKPVHFLIGSHMTGFFPEPVRRFWSENYQLYFGPVFVVGRRLVADETARWDVFAPGRYRWQALDDLSRSQLRIDGATLRNGEVVQLARGAHDLRATGGPGRIVFALASEPAWSSAGFYAVGAIREIVGGGYFPR